MASPLGAVDTAGVLGNAMTDYLLAVGSNNAPAAPAPDHMAAWLDAHGYLIVRRSGGGTTTLEGPHVERSLPRSTCACVC